MTVLSDLLSSQVVDVGDVARVTHSSVPRVIRWQRSATAPRRRAQERLLELAAVVDLATRTFDHATTRRWLHAPVPALDGATPLHLVAAGRHRDVLDVLLGFAEGVTG